MFKNINIVKLVLYIIFINFVFTNGALIFEYFYSDENRAVALYVFVLTMIGLVVVPTYYIAKTNWLKK